LDFVKYSSFDEENNSINIYDNYNITEPARERTSPDFFLGENLIDTKIPIHYQSPPNGLESENIKKIRNSNTNSNTNIDKPNYDINLNVMNYIDNNGNMVNKNSNKNVNEIYISKNCQIRNCIDKYSDFQKSVKNNFNNSAYKSFIATNNNNVICPKAFIQTDLISNNSQNNNRNKNLIAFNANDNMSSGHNRNTISNKDNKILKTDFQDETLDLKFSNSIDFQGKTKNEKDHNPEKLNLTTYDEPSSKLKIDCLGKEKNSIKKRNLVKIFGKNILSVNIFFQKNNFENYFTNSLF